MLFLHLGARVVLEVPTVYSVPALLGKCPGGECRPRRTDHGPPPHFEVAVESAPKGWGRGESSSRLPTPSVSVSAYGETYRLCGVIFKQGGEMECFSCQALYGCCWHTYHSCDSDSADDRHRYAQNPSMGKDMEPRFFAYFYENDRSRRSRAGLPLEEAGDAIESHAEKRRVSEKRFKATMAPASFTAALTNLDGCLTLLCIRVQDIGNMIQLADVAADESHVFCWSLFIGTILSASIIPAV